MTDLIFIFNKFATIFKRKIKVIMLFALIGFFAGILYAVCFFKPSYEARANLLIKNIDKTTFAGKNNLLLTQTEIMKSNGFAEKVRKKSATKHKIFENKKSGVRLIKKIVKIKNPPSSNIITISVKHPDSATAKDTASAVAETCITFYTETAKKGLVKSSNVLKNRLATAEAKLAKTRTEIKNFKQKNSVIDIKTESVTIINQIAELENKYSDVTSKAFAEAEKTNSLSQNLGMNHKEAVLSAVLGNNPDIVKIQNKLIDLEHNRAALATKYTDFHPIKIAADAEINHLKEKLANNINTISDFSGEKNNIIINDPVRTGMIKDLIAGNTAGKGFRAQADNLKSLINELKTRKSEIPRFRVILDKALQEETNSANAVNTLKSEQTKIKIKEAAIAGNISLIGEPAVPDSRTFPGRFAVIALFALSGAFIGIATVSITALLKNTYCNIEQMEKELKTTVFGVVPWLDKEVYADSGRNFAFDEAVSLYSLAYQKIISGLRIKGCHENINALAFTSSEFSKYRSTIIMNIAYGLSRTNQSVIIVDADFRTPSLSREFDLMISDKFNLAELISEISRDRMQTGSFNSSKLDYFIKELPKAGNLYIIPNKGNVSDPCEYLHSESFRLLIHELKKRYDRVLVDVPPALAVSDALAASSAVDGTVIITGLDVNRAITEKIYKKFKNYNAPIFGIIARELNTKESESSDEYIKQILAGVMSKNETLSSER